MEHANLPLKQTEKGDAKPIELTRKYLDVDNKIKNWKRKQRKKWKKKQILMPDQYL